MRAAQLCEVGAGVAGLQLVELPAPTPAPDEVLVRVAAVSASKLDLHQTMAGVGLGRAVRPPVVLGMDPAGTVVAQGGEVVGDLVGSRVAIKPNVVCGRCDYCRRGHEADCVAQQVLGVHRDGGLAEFVAVPARQIFAIADELDFVTAAAGVHTVAVARHLLGTAGSLADRVVVVLGASGAVGSAVVQLAVARGARVLAIGSSIDRLCAALTSSERIVLRECGDPGELSNVVRAVTDRPVAAVLDTTGSAALLSAGIGLLGWGGVAASCAGAAGNRLDIDLGALYRMRRRVIGVGASDFADVRAALNHLAQSRVRLHFAGRFPLTEVRQAYDELANRATAGKVMVTLP